MLCFGQTKQINDRNYRGNSRSGDLGLILRFREDGVDLHGSIDDGWSTLFPGCAGIIALVSAPACGSSESAAFDVVSVSTDGFLRLHHREWSLLLGIAIFACHYRVFLNEFHSAAGLGGGNILAEGISQSPAGCRSDGRVGWQRHIFCQRFKTRCDTGTGNCVVGLVAFSAFGVLGREVARDRKVSTLLLTALPLAIGGVSLLLIGVPLEGLPHMTMTAWGLVVWLAVINTALAYVIYYNALKVLTALEMNVLLNITPLLTAIWAWFLLGEQLTTVEWVGMLVAVVGIGLVQQRRK